MSATQFGPRPSAAPQESVLAGRWSVSPELSHARFRVRDKLVATVRGSMPVHGGVVVVSAEGDPTDAWVDLAVGGMATGNGHRDRDLQRPAFLDAAAHPTVRVSARQPTSTPTGWTVQAVVVARGAEAPVDLTIQIVAESMDEIRVRVAGRLDRTPLGIKAPTFVVGRFLDLEADLTYRRETDRA